MDHSVTERFTAIETKVAYHDKDLAELSTTVFRQQQLLDQMQAELSRVRAQLSALGIDADPTKDQPPPHY